MRVASAWVSETKRQQKSTSGKTLTRRTSLNPKLATCASFDDPGRAGSRREPVWISTWCTWRQAPELSTTARTTTEHEQREIQVTNGSRLLSNAVQESARVNFPAVSKSVLEPFGSRWLVAECSSPPLAQEFGSHVAFGLRLHRQQ